MDKGATAASSIALLRYARAVGLQLYWNILVSFPNDELEFYTEQLEILPYIQHLQPPFACPVIIARFSPYHDRPERYGITELRPAAFYAEIYPERADIGKLAYHFEASFASAAREHPEVLAEIGRQINAWRQRYYSARPPVLRVERRGGGYVLVDTRGLPGLPAEQAISEEQAAMALVPRRVRSAARERYAWALAHKLVVERDDRYVPFAIAEPELLAELEERCKRPGDALLALAV
jgi:hypothetical protein